MSKNDEFSISNEELCIKNEELCIKSIKNEELCIKNKEFCIKHDGFCSDDSDDEALKQEAAKGKWAGIGAISIEESSFPIAESSFVYKIRPDTRHCDCEAVDRCA